MPRPPWFGCSQSSEFQSRMDHESFGCMAGPKQKERSLVTRSNRHEKKLAFQDLGVNVTGKALVWMLPKLISNSRMGHTFLANVSALLQGNRTFPKVLVGAGFRGPSHWYETSDSTTWMCITFPPLQTTRTTCTASNNLSRRSAAK